MIKRIGTGDRVEIGFKDVKGERRRLATVVEAVLTNAEVLILMPIADGKMIRLPTEGSFEARFYTGSSVFVYDVSVLEYPVIDGIFLTKLRLNSLGERIQLRDYYRINSSLSFSFSIAREEFDEDEEAEPLVQYDAMTKDFSGGGMSFITDEELPAGTEVCANFLLDGEYIVVLGKVMGYQETQNLPYKYQYRCKFLGVPDMEQEKIIQFINNQQYKSISKVRENSMGNI